MLRKIQKMKISVVVVGAALAASLAAASAQAPQPSAVPEGTRFLVRLESKLNTRKDKVGKKFKVRTMEPLQASDGQVIPAGAEIRGRISRLERASVTGRARLWLSFDDIRTPAGRMPLVASVAGTPGEYSVRSGESREGEIEARTSKGRQDAEAAAVGAVIAVAHRRDAARAAVDAFLMSSGMGQELELAKGSKIELQLDRPLSLAAK